MMTGMCGHYIMFEVYYIRCVISYICVCVRACVHMCTCMYIRGQDFTIHTLRVCICVCVQVCVRERGRRELNCSMLCFRRGSSQLYASASSSQTPTYNFFCYTLISRQYAKLQMAINVLTTSLLFGNGHHLGACQQCRILGTTPN